MSTVITVLGRVLAALFLLACVGAVWLFVSLRRRVRAGTPVPAAAGPEPVETPRPESWPEWLGDEPANVESPRAADLVQVGASPDALIHRACRDHRTSGHGEICLRCQSVLAGTQRGDGEST